MSMQNNAQSSKTGPAGEGVMSEDLYRKEVNNSKISKQLGSIKDGYSPSQKDKIPSMQGIYQNKMERSYKLSVTRKWKYLNILFR